MEGVFPVVCDIPNDNGNMHILSIIHYMHTHTRTVPSDITGNEITDKSNQLLPASHNGLIGFSHFRLVNCNLLSNILVVNVQCSSAEFIHIKEVYCTLLLK